MNHENKTLAIESFKTDLIPKIVIKNSIPALIGIGVDGLIWAQPITDVLSLVVIIIMLCRKIKKTDFSASEAVLVNE